MFRCIHNKNKQNRSTFTETDGRVHYTLDWDTGTGARGATINMTIDSHKGGGRENATGGSSVFCGARYLDAKGELATGWNIKTWGAEQGCRTFLGGG